MSIHEALKSKRFMTAALIVGVVIIALVSFACGVLVGFHKARFSYRFGENYERNFIGGPGKPAGMMGQVPGGMMQNFGGRGFRNGNGTAGKIVSISENNIVLQDRNGQENTVTVSDKTIIKDRQSSINLSDLKAGEQVVVVGSPGDNGTVNADLIRIFDGNFPMSDNYNNAAAPNNAPSGNTNPNPANSGQ